MAAHIPNFTQPTRIGGVVEQGVLISKLKLLHRKVKFLPFHERCQEHTVLRCYSSSKHGAPPSQESTHIYSDDRGEMHSLPSDFVCIQQRSVGRKSPHASQGLAQACKFIHNDAKFVNERAQNDISLLSRGITKINNRARQDVAFLGMGFLKIDARARKDTQMIDHDVKRRAADLNNITALLKERARSDLKRAADCHWSDGALEADLRRADFIVKRRAMEDAFIALKFMKDIHDMMAKRSYDKSQIKGRFSTNKTLGLIMLEKNGHSNDLLSREISRDQISAIEDAYWSMASALSEADGIDYSDPEEVELLVSALIDLDAMDGKSSVSLLAECSSSPDVNMRKALANALAAAPSIWILGNAGMGALQRLAQDSNPAVSAAASKAISELRKQWELREGDSLRFMRKECPPSEGNDYNCNEDSP